VPSFDWHGVQIALPVSAAKFVLLTGEPKTAVKTAERQESLARLLRQLWLANLQTFAARSIHSEDRRRVDQAAQSIYAVRQIWRCSALPWVDSIAVLQTFERNPKNINRGEN
jgi:hypothetical protein